MDEPKLDGARSPGPEAPERPEAPAAGVRYFRIDFHRCVIVEGRRARRPVLRPPGEKR